MPNHSVRCDLSDKVLRVSETRISLSFEKTVVIKPRKQKEEGFLPSGAIVIMNSNSGRYMGEMQIILKDNDVKLTSKMNYCGIIKNNDFKYIFKYVYAP